MINKSFSLREIASWTSGNSEVTIPALQRGLVWKPSQVELLWDSILRGFPIGSFMLSDIVEEGQQGKYYLMDGQQRYNAISIGYNTVEKARAVLWIDLEPPTNSNSTNNNSTRLFWVKATTIPHPWGFKNDDECSRLSTKEKREAIDLFGLQGNIYNREFSLKETWPVEADCPIPLWCLLEAVKSTRDNAEAFLQKSRDIFMSTDFAYRNKIVFREKACHYVREVLFPAIVALDDYRINCNHLSKKVIESETETIKSDAAGQSMLEVLFRRLNTGGTDISKEDLNYSAIKAYWPSIKDINDKLAEKYMSPAKLVMLAFRLALTDTNDESLKNELNVQQICNIANDESKRSKIECLYNLHLEFILKRVDEWLGVTQESPLKTPSILRTIIGRNSPDIYLLLMYFAYQDILSPIELTALQIKGLAFCLHWFSNNKKGCVQEIFKRCKNGITLNNIQKGISKLMYDNLLLHVYNPTEVQNFITKIGKTSNWRVWRSIPAPSHNFFDRIFWNKNSEPREMLLYVEREYINTHFSNYDPAKQDMWDTYNRPWDFDHIVAQDRIKKGEGTRGPFREYDIKWCDSIGNFAAITLESNRSKSNGVDFSEYHNNSESLYYDNDFETLPFRLTYDPEASVKFAQMTYSRFCKIYNNVYVIMKDIFSQTILSDTLLVRRELYSKIVELYPDAIIHFAASDGNDHRLIREQDWSREWIGVGLVKGDFMVCLEWDAIMENGTPTNVEYGIRKAIGTSVSKENMQLLTGEDILDETLNDWWYLCDDECQSIDIDFVKDKFDHYLKIIKEL